MNIEELTNEQLDRLQQRLNERAEERDREHYLAVKKWERASINRICIGCGYKVRREGQLHADKYCNKCG